MISENEYCKWIACSNEDYSVFETECGETHMFSEGGIKENSHKYCPYCGGLITGRHAIPVAEHRQIEN